MNTSYCYDTEYDDIFGWEDEVVDLIPRATHKTVADAIFCIVEQLYNSENAIDEQKLRQSFAYLCDEFGVDDEMLRDEHGLCVVHWKNARDWAKKNDSNIVRKNFTGWTQ